MNDSEHNDVADPIHGSELSHCVSASRIKAANFPNGLFGKLSVRMVDSMPPCPFIHRIMVIVPDGSKPEVVRIHTTRVVSTGAVVTNAEPFWDFSFKQLPRIAMRRDDPPVYRQSAVSKLHFASLPQPASRGFFDMVKKTNPWIKEAGSRAVMVFHGLHENLCSVVRLAADVACNRHAVFWARTSIVCNN